MEEVVADGDRRSLQGLVGTPLPRRSALPICLKQAVPRTEGVLYAEGGSQALGQRRAAPLPHLRGPGREGVRQLWKGGPLSY